LAHDERVGVEFIALPHDLRVFGVGNFAQMYANGHQKALEIPGERLKEMKIITLGVETNLLKAPVLGLRT
jgi:hypothetical protein